MRPVSLFDSIGSIYALFGCACVAATAVGVWAWRAGGRSQAFSMPLAYLAFLAVFIPAGYQAAGLRGILVGWFVAFAFGYSLLAVASVCAYLKCRRAATLGLTTIFGQFMVMAVIARDWPFVALASGYLGATWLADHLLRPNGWVEQRLQPWLTQVVRPRLTKAATWLDGHFEWWRHGVEILTATLAPALAMVVLMATPSGIVHGFVDALGRDFPFNTFSTAEMTLAALAAFTAAYCVAPSADTRHERRAVCLAATPFVLWLLAARVLGAAGANFTTLGVLFAIVFALATWNASIVGACRDEPV